MLWLIDKQQISLYNTTVLITTGREKNSNHQGGFLMITKIIKRDGREVPFNIEKIANAIFKAATATGGKDYDTALKLAEKTVEYI